MISGFWGSSRPKRRRSTRSSGRTSSRWKSQTKRNRFGTLCLEWSPCPASAAEPNILSRRRRGTHARSVAGQWISIYKPTDSPAKKTPAFVWTKPGRTSAVLVTSTHPAAWNKKRHKPYRLVPFFVILFRRGSLFPAARSRPAERRLRPRSGCGAGGCHRSKPTVA